MSTSYELYYFGVHGRAESIRLLFALAGCGFLDQRLGREEWLKKKSEMPLGQMPVLLERDDQGERFIPQSQAILRHLARTFGLAGTTEVEVTAVDVASETALDAGTGLSPLLFGAQRGDASAVAKYFADVWPVHARRLEKLLAQNGTGSGFFVGERPTVADAAVFQVLHAHAALQPTALEPFAGLRAYHDRMSVLPQWRSYVEQRPAHEGTSARPAA